LGGVAALLAWLWQSDRAPAEVAAQVGQHGSLAVGAVGKASHSWWATVVLIVVDASIFAALAFAHLHVSMLASVCPPPGARLPADAWTWVGIAAAMAAAVAMRVLGRHGVGTGAVGRLPGFTAMVALATLLAVIAWATGWAAHDAAELSPRANAWSATVAALLAWQGFHVVVLGVMSTYLLARRWSGRLIASRRATLDNIEVFWQYTLLQGAIAVSLVQWLPL
jgi:cytochrome c oxidase subunit I+III